jgi:hypothetical protein
VALRRHRGLAWCSDIGNGQPIHFRGSRLHTAMVATASLQQWIFTGRRNRGLAIEECSYLKNSKSRLPGRQESAVCAQEVWRWIRAALTGSILVRQARADPLAPAQSELRH